MTEGLSITELPNGLAVIVEEMSHVESIAYALYIPGGVIHDQPEALGCSLVLAELTSRGAGAYDSRALSAAFDRRGIRHGESAGHDVFVYRGSLLAEYLPEALELTALMVKAPQLPSEEILSIRGMLLQDIKALDDNPASKVMVELGQRYYPEPYGRSSLGTLAGLEASSAERVRAQWAERYHPAGAVLSVAGNVRAQEVLELVVRHFGDWQGRAAERPPFGPMPVHREDHVQSESAQLQIALAYPSAPFGDEHYYAAKVATAVLSGGMFGRIYVEAREKRGLCYNIYARHSAAMEYGTLLVYAGTTPDRAHETLAVVVQELGRLKGTATQEEIARAKVDILAAMVIGEESASARAASNAGDWWVARRVRSLDEIRREINRIGVKEIDAYLERFPARSFMLLTLGARRLELLSEGGAA